MPTKDYIAAKIAAEEIRHSYGDDGPDVFYTFTCISCGVETDIKNYSGPSHLILSKSKWLESKK